VVTKTVEEKRDELGTRSKWLLWIGMLLPPAAWSVAMEAVYLTDVYTCSGWAIRSSHISSAAGLIFCIIGGFVAWKAMPQRTGDSPEPLPLSRSVFMSVLGIALAVLFGLLILAQWLPVIYGVPCSK
jgi:hypothetical protein